MAEEQNQTKVTNTEVKDNTEQKEQKINAEEIKTKAIDELLQTLGIENTETLQGIVTKHNEQEESNKTELEKVNGVLSKTTKALAEEQDKRMMAEAKLEAIKQGARIDLVDDVVVIAKSRVTKDKDIVKVISEMKESKSIYFEDTQAADDNTKPEKKVETTVTRKRVEKNDEQEPTGEPTVKEKYAGTLAERIFAKKKKSNTDYQYWKN
uniref:Major capsid protein n=1 Tax=Dulem virus 36 TaxID=3145754 RepID=A0AAU8AYP7_9CAUD